MAAAATSSSRPSAGASPTSARLPAGPAGRRLERPPARHPPGHHPAGHPPRHHRPPHSPAIPPRAARPLAPTRRPAARRRPRRRARLRKCAGISGGPAGHPGVDAGRGGRRAWRGHCHSASPDGPLRDSAGGADPAAARHRRARTRTPGAGTGRAAAAPGTAGGAGLCWDRGVSTGSVCRAGLVGAAAVRRAWSRPPVDRHAASAARAARLTYR
jgi:hypothetical protein